MRFRQRFVSQDCCRRVRMRGPTGYDTSIENDTVIDMAIRKRDQDHFWRHSTNKACYLAIQFGNWNVSYKRRRDCEEFGLCHAHDLERRLGLLYAYFKHLSIV